MNARGAAGVVLLAVVAAALALCVVLADVGGFLAARLQAAAAADAAALAAAPVTFAAFGGTASPTTAAREIAAANGADLVECRCEIDRSWAPRRVAVVTSRVVDLMLFGPTEVRARSAAEFDPRTVVPP